MTPVEVFGKDHWSLLCYCMICCLDRKGQLVEKRLRMDGTQYPTILKDGIKIKDHNDMDCLFDLEMYGFIKNIGTGINPIIRMTDKGLKVFNHLLKHKQEGGSYSNFDYKSKMIK